MLCNCANKLHCTLYVINVSFNEINMVYDRNLSKEEAQERLKDSDTNNDQILTWHEYLQDTFGVDTDDELSAEDMGDSGMVNINCEQIYICKTEDCSCTSLGYVPSAD